MSRPINLLIEAAERRPRAPEGLMARQTLGDVLFRFVFNVESQLVVKISFEDIGAQDRAQPIP